MARVIGTRGKLVSFQVDGVDGTVARMNKRLIGIKDGADLGVFRAGKFIQEEVKESIAGARAERRNVDTGLLIKSIESKRTGEAEAVIKPRTKIYPGTSATTNEVATILEFGGQSRIPQPHFRNTEKRNMGNVRDIIDKAVKIALL